MNLEQLAEEVNKNVNLWSQDKDKLVVCIDGYAGIGKTTLLNKIVEINPRIVGVNRDDFMIPSVMIKEKLANAEDKSKVFESEILDYKKLEDFISAFRNTNEVYKINAYDNEGTTGEVNVLKVFDFSKNILIIEGVFMFHPELPHSKLWDKRIYLKGDKDKIAERRVTREKKRYGKFYFPEDHPDSYFRHVIMALERYIGLYNPEQIADLVLSVD